MKNTGLSEFAVASALVVGIAALLQGCPAATITPEQAAAPLNTVEQRPDRIVIYDFDVPADTVTPNDGPLQKAYRAVSGNQEQDEEKRLEIGREAAKDLSEDLVKQLKEMGFEAERLPRGTPVSGNVMIIDGRFLNADEGNRARRLIVGFGAGQSSLDTQVTVSQTQPSGAPAQLLAFTTHSDSGKMPGAALTMGAGAAAQGASAASAGTAVMSAGKVYSSMLGTLAGKTSSQITSYLSRYFASRGWIQADQARNASIAE